MKKQGFIIFLALIAGMVLVTASCKKEDKTTDHPELAGNWHGYTSQSIPIKVEVRNLEGDLFVTKVQVKYSVSPGDTGEIMRYNSGGLAKLTDTTFKVYLDDLSPVKSFIDGTFNTGALTLAGTFSIILESDPANPYIGSYTASQSK